MRCWPPCGPLSASPQRTRNFNVQSGQIYYAVISKGTWGASTQGSPESFDGAPARAQPKAGRVGRGGAAERASFRPTGPEARDMKPATTRSRIKPGAAYGSRRSQRARSAGRFQGFYGPGKEFRELFGAFGRCLLLASLSSRKTTFGVCFARKPAASRD